MYNEGFLKLGGKQHLNFRKIVLLVILPSETVLLEESCQRFSHNCKVLTKLAIKPTIPKNLLSWFLLVGIGKLVIASTLAWIGLIPPVPTTCPKYVTHALPKLLLARLMVSYTCIRRIKNCFIRCKCCSQVSLKMMILSIYPSHPFPDLQDLDEAFAKK